MLQCHGDVMAIMSKASPSAYGNTNLTYLVTSETIIVFVFFFFVTAEMFMGVENL